MPEDPCISWSCPARPVRLAAPRGDFAALRAEPSDRPHRGTVLLLPGHTGSKEEFVPLLPYLVDVGYRAIAVDARGQYETDDPDDEAAYRQKALAMDVLAQAETLGEPCTCWVTRWAVISPGRRYCRIPGHSCPSRCCPRGRPKRVDFGSRS
ncbi:alpha/beta fold hydrolase [Streptomyces sp. NPDC059866]|uniref:alpha/beta fold hydrolase n=1 Tax=Streptomyces sp. NPDC059866 TaxID=3346978 RepID=UPI0036615339